MDVSVWQVLIYLAPTVAHSDEAVRAECLPRVQGNIIFHIISEQKAISCSLQAREADQGLPSSRKRAETAGEVGV